MRVRPNARPLAVLAVLAVGVPALMAAARPAPPSPTSARALGLALPRQSVVISPTVDGRIATVDVEEGERVRAGQVLVRLDDRVVAASVALERTRAQAEGRVAQARADVAYAESMLRRISALGTDAASREHEDAEHAVHRAEAALAAALDDRAVAEASWHREEARLAEYALVAPFDAVVTRRTLGPGAGVEPNAPILTLIDVSRLRAEIHVSAELAPALHVGRTYELVAESPVDRVLTGTLLAVEPVIDPSSGTMRVVFDLPNDDGALPAGFAVRLDVEALAALAVVETE